MSAPVASAAPPTARPSNRGHRWTEEDVDPPADLRLVPMALAMWAGSIGALLVGPTGLLPWLLAGAAGFAVSGLLLLTRRHRPVGWPGHGLAVGLIALAVGLGIAGAAVLSADGHPLTGAGENGRYVTLTVHLDSAPQLLPAMFGGDDSGDDAAGPAAGAPPPQRVRVPGTAVRSVIGDRAWDGGSAAVSVVGTGTAWSELVPGQLIEVSGLASVDDFPVIPAVRVRATTGPAVLDDAAWWSRGAARIRADLKVRAGTLGGDPAGLLPGLVVGDTSGIDDRLDADAKATGLTHLLAVSGSHFAVVCGAVVLLLLRRFGPRVAATGGLAVLLGLVVLVGPEPSVLRAAVMGGITVLALFSGRTRTALPALAAAIVVLLAIDPALALSPGFAMSVLATAGLVLLAPPWAKALRARGFPRGWAELLVVPLAASVTTLPIVVALSGSIPIATIPANLLAAVVVPPALIIGLLCALSGPLHPGTADVLAAIDRPLLDWIAWVAHTLAGLPNATASWPAALPWVLILTGLLVATLGVLRHHRIRACCGAALAGAATVLLPVQVLPPVGWPPADWLIAGCEVGQGDAFVLSTDQPDTAVVFDTGPEPGLVDRCLDRLGVGTVPLLVLTHLHADHVDGLAGVLDGRSVGMIGVGPGREPAAAWNAVVSAAGAAGIPVVQLHPGDRWSAAGLAVSVLGPARSFTGTASDPNNDSIVARAEHAGVSMLLTGDIEPEAQRALLNSGADLRADVLKVPHHGSAKELPEFLAAVSPTVAVIGVGRDNDYGHPAPSLLSRLAAAGVAEVQRTDLQGDVVVGLDDGVLVAAHRGPLIRGG